MSLPSQSNELGSVSSGDTIAASDTNDIRRYIEDILISRSQIKMSVNGVISELETSNLASAYVTAKAQSPTSANIVTLLFPPATYTLSSQLILDTAYINLVGLDRYSCSITGNVTASNQGLLHQTADNVVIRNLKITNTSDGGSKTPAGSSVEQCVLASTSSPSSEKGGGAINVYGRFEDCYWPTGSYFCNSDVKTGEFKNCVFRNAQEGNKSIVTAKYYHCEFYQSNGHPFVLSQSTGVLLHNCIIEGGSLELVRNTTFINCRVIDSQIELLLVGSATNTIVGGEFTHSTASIFLNSDPVGNTVRIAGNPILVGTSLTSGDGAANIAFVGYGFLMSEFTTGLDSVEGRLGYDSDGDVFIGQFGAADNQFDSSAYP
jgi:hypothetical protein